MIFNSLMTIALLLGLVGLAMSFMIPTMWGLIPVYGAFLILGLSMIWNV